MKEEVNFDNYKKKYCLTLIFMTMKKIFNYALAAALVGGLSLSVTSCKSDEDVVVERFTPSTVTIDNDLIAHGVVTDMENTVVEVPVKCDGDWVAILSIDDAEDDDKNLWVKIQDWKGFYNGNQTLRLQFDDNITGVDRATTLTIANSNGDIQTVPVRQNFTWKGQAPTNSSAQAFQNKGIGYGIDYGYLLDMKSVKFRNSTGDAAASQGNTDADSKEYNPLKVKKMDNIYHLTAIDQLCREGKMGADKDAYVEEPIEIANLDAEMLDSAMIKQHDLSIGLHLGASIGPIEFGITGKYVDKRREDKGYIDYVITRTSPVWDVSTSPAAIAQYAGENSDVDFKQSEKFIKKVQNMRTQYIKQNMLLTDKSKLDADSLTKTQKKVIDGLYSKQLMNFSYGGVYSSYFENCMSKLYNHIVLRLEAGMKIASDKADRVCQDLDDHFGPFIIAGGQFGGSMVITMKVDTTRLEGHTELSGKAELELNLGVGSGEGSADATWIADGWNRLRSYTPSIHIYGGSARETEAELIGILFSENPDSHEQWVSMLTNWMQSMVQSADDGNMSQAAPISFTAVPIWHYFPDTEVSNYVRSYFMNKYKTRGIQSYMDIIDDVPGHKSFIELLNEMRKDEPDEDEEE